MVRDLTVGGGQHSILSFIVHIISPGYGDALVDGRGL